MSALGDYVHLTTQNYLNWGPNRRERGPAEDANTQIQIFEKWKNKIKADIEKNSISKENLKALSKEYNDKRVSLAKKLQTFAQENPEDFYVFLQKVFNDIAKIELSIETIKSYNISLNTDTMNLDFSKAKLGEAFEKAEEGFIIKKMAGKTKYSYLSTLIERYRGTASYISKVKSIILPDILSEIESRLEKVKNMLDYLGTGPQKAKIKLFGSSILKKNLTSTVEIGGKEKSWIELIEKGQVPYELANAINEELRSVLRSGKSVRFFASLKSAFAEAMLNYVGSRTQIEKNAAKTLIQTIQSQGRQMAQRSAAVKNTITFTPNQQVLREIEAKDSKKKTVKVTGSNQFGDVYSIDFDISSEKQQKVDGVLSINLKKGERELGISQKTYKISQEYQRNANNFYKKEITLQKDTPLFYLLAEAEGNNPQDKLGTRFMNAFASTDQSRFEMNADTAAFTRVKQAAVEALKLQTIWAMASGQYGGLENKMVASIILVEDTGHPQENGIKRFNFISVPRLILGAEGRTYENFISLNPAIENLKIPNRYEPLNRKENRAMGAAIQRRLTRALASLKTIKLSAGLSFEAISAPGLSF